MDGWMDGWTNELQRSGRSPVRYSREGTQRRQRWCPCWEYTLVNKFTWNTERHHPEKQLVYACECTCMCEWSVISALEAKGKETPVNKTVAHSTSCQRKYYHEGSGFYLLVTEVVLESFKVFIPYNFILHRGITFNYIHTFNIFKSLKNTSAIGFGVNMVHGHKEDTCFKKCRITLLQLIYRAG